MFGLILGRVAKLANTYRTSTSQTDGQTDGQKQQQYSIVGPSNSSSAGIGSKAVIHDPLTNKKLTHDPYVMHDQSV